LRQLSSKDYQFKSPSGHDFYINVCGPVRSETWALDRPEDVAGFFRREHGDFSIGSVNTTIAVRDGHPVLIMTDGSRCPKADSMTTSTAIRFICDTSVFGAGKPELLAQLPPDDDAACAFLIEWRTHVACPTHEKTGSIGFLTVLAALLATVFMLYILVGTWYNRYVSELRGFDQIPRISIFSFSDTIALVREWIRRVKDRSPSSWHAGSGGTWSRGGSNSYAGLAEEEEAMMHGPPGFLDEQDEEEVHPSENPRPAGMDSNGVIRL